MLRRKGARLQARTLDAPKTLQTTMLFSPQLPPTWASAALTSVNRHKMEFLLGQRLVSAAFLNNSRRLR
jgi:hypothetical protein